MIRECFKRFAFTFLSPLAVRNVQKRKLVVFFVSDCGSDARVHTAGNETDGELWSIVVDDRLELFSFDFCRAAHQTPFTSGPQMYLCSCNCMRTFKPLPATQSASACRSTKPQAGDIRTALVRDCSSCFSITFFA